MLTELCNELRNWFEQKIYYGSVSISGSGVTVGGAPLSDYLQTGQYYRIVGSVFNDGVHQYGTEQLDPENAFNGAIWAMAVPREVINLSEDIDAWCKANESALNSPYQSESFGGYSYSLKSGSGGSGDSGASYTWRDQFAAQLRKWRKLK